VKKAERREKNSVRHRGPPTKHLSSSYSSKKKQKKRTSAPREKRHLPADRRVEKEKKNEKKLIRPYPFLPSSQQQEGEGGGVPGGTRSGQEGALGHDPCVKENPPFIGRKGKKSAGIPDGGGDFSISSATEGKR